jgi:hypothetical protein
MKIKYKYKNKQWTGKKEKFYRPPQRLDAGGQHSPALNV